MDTESKTPARIYAGLGAILSKFAIVMQFYLILLSRTTSFGETIVRFFSYFTILSNILVAITFTVTMSNLNTRMCRFCRKPSTLTAVTVYIVIVGIVYNLLLRMLWKPEGLQYLVDELLHSVIPVMYLIFWICFVPKKTLAYKNSFTWMLFPIAYSVFIFIRGNSSGFYPYPFIDVTQIGLTRALTNGAYMLLVFFLFSLLLIFIGKLIVGNKVVRERVVSR